MPAASLPVDTMRRVTRSTRITPSTTHMVSIPMSTCFWSSRLSQPGARNAPVRFTTHTRFCFSGICTSAASHVPDSSPKCRARTVPGSVTGP